MTQTYDLVRVVNTGSEPLTLRGNTVYVIPAEGERIIPFLEAASWFGDPRLTDDGRNRFRSEAYKQTQNLWGYTEGMKYMRDRWDPSAGFLGWDDFMPSVKCFDMDNSPMHFLIHDPDGTQGTSNAPALIDPSLLDAQALSKQVQDMGKQMAKLQQMLLERASFDTQTPTPSQEPGPHPIPQTEATVAAAVANEAASMSEAVEFPQPPTDDIVTDDAPRTVRSGGRSR
jgi:hypothetical protein